MLLVIILVNPPFSITHKLSCFLVPLPNRLLTCLIPEAKSSHRGLKLPLFLLERLKICIPFLEILLSLLLLKCRF